MDKHLVKENKHAPGIERYILAAQERAWFI